MRLFARILTVVSVAITVHQPAAAQSVAPPTLDSAARVIVRDFAARWKAMNTHGLSDLFALDADLVIPTGQVLSGRAAIRVFYDGVFKAGYAGSESGGNIVRVRGLTPEIGIVDATWFITGAKTPTGDPQAPERGILTAILRREGSVWHIAALREQTGATELTFSGPGPRR